MKLTTGVLGEDPGDGVLRGRVGARRWLFQWLWIFVLMLIHFIVMLVLLLQLKVIALAIVFGTTILIAMSMSSCRTPWMWLGVDQTPPVIFDLKNDTLEVGSWASTGQMLRKRVAADTLQDLRVYWAPAASAQDLEAAVNFAAPLASLATVAESLPRQSDAFRECCRFGRRLCCATPNFHREIPVVFLGAAVKGQTRIVRLSRNVSRESDINGLMDLARTARQRLGLQDELPPTVLGATSKATAANKDVVAAPSALKAARQGDEEEPPEKLRVPPRFQDEDCVESDFEYEDDSSDGEDAKKSPQPSPPAAAVAKPAGDRSAPAGSDGGSVDSAAEALDSLIDQLPERNAEQKKPPPKAVQEAEEEPKPSAARTLSPPVLEPAAAAVAPVAPAAATVAPAAHAAVSVAAADEPVVVKLEKVENVDAQGVHRPRAKVKAKSRA